MKLHILFPFVDGPWGGCNQFLKALRAELRRRGAYAETPAEADAALFDSYNMAGEVLALKAARPGLPLLHRLDGPISSYRGRDRAVDRLIHHLNHLLADATVFQSRYSREGNLALGMRPPGRWRIIGNAPDPELFHPAPERTPEQAPAPERRIRLVATSWSANPNKGFDVYAHLDRALDFSRFEMLFVGNAPSAFVNIRHLPPQGSAALAGVLRGCDIYVAGSRNDPCSNALLEAMACGLPAVVRRSGGHPELVGGAGEVFDDPAEAVAAIEAVAARLGDYRARLAPPRIEALAGDYLALAGEAARGAAKAPAPWRLALARWRMRLVLGNITAQSLLRRLGRSLRRPGA